MWSGFLNRSAVPEAVPLGLDGQASANDVALGAEVIVSCVARIATRVEAERVVRTDVEVLIFEAEEHIDQRALVDHDGD